MNRWTRASERIAVSSLIALVLATAAGFIKGAPWWLEVFVHFRWQYVLASLPLLAFFTYRRGLREALVAGLVALANGIPVADVHFAGSSDAAAAHPGGRATVLSFNLWDENSNRAAVSAYLAGSSADLVFLTEVTPDWLAALSDLDTIYPHRYDVGDTALTDGVRLGVMVLSKDPLIETRTLVDGPSGHAFAQIARVDRPGASWTLIGVHLHKPLFDEVTHQDRQLKALTRVARDAPGPVIVAGDFNMTPFSPKFRTLLSETGTTRAAGGLNPSWPSWTGPFGIPIDNVLAKRGMRARTAVGPHMGSDHRPMVTDIEWDG